MKSGTKRRLILLTVTLTLLLALGTLGVIAYASGGEGEESGDVELSVVSKNVSYSDSLHLLYAVSGSGFDTAVHEIRMLFWDEPQSEYLLGSESLAATARASATVGGKPCAVFYSRGIAAREMTVDIYARPCVEIDGTVYYGAVEKFSVLEYAYAMREKGGLSEAQTAMLDTMLSYGGAAQRLLGFMTDRPADAVYYSVSTVGGSLADGFTHGRFPVGTEVALTAPAESDGIAFAYWQNAAGEKLSEEQTFTVTVGEADETYTAVFEENPRYSEGLAYTLSPDGTYYSVSGIGDCKDTDLVIPPEHEGLPVNSSPESKSLAVKVK